LYLKIYTNFSASNRYDLEMEDMLAPPPLSLSAPELNLPPPPEPIMRPAVSSTELLYERAMARFYQAVAFEESENMRKRSFSVEADRARKRSIDQPNQLDLPVAPRMRLNSLTETDRRSNLRRRLSGDYTPTKNTLFKQNSKETEEHHSEVEEKPVRREPEPIKEELLETTPSPPPKSREEDISDDYTDSTVSSMESMTQRMLEHEERHARFKDEHDEMDTYHPPRVTMSPPPPTYSAADSKHAAEVLTRKYQLPDPNFVPKPILKRPSVSREDVGSPTKPDKHGLLHFFDRSRKSKSPSPAPPSPQPVQTNIAPPLVRPETEAPKSPPPVEPPKENIETPAPKKTASNVKNKAIISREHSLEENHAMADFYAGIVQEVAVKRVIKRKVPLYMNPDEIKKAEEQLEKEESNENLQRNLSPVGRFRQPENRPSVVGRAPVLPPPPAPVVEKKEETKVSMFNYKEPKVVTEEEFMARLKSQGGGPAASVAKPVLAAVAPKEEEHPKPPTPVETPERGRKSGTAVRTAGQSATRNRSQSGVRTRNGSAVRAAPRDPSTEPPQPRPARTVSKTRMRSESKSPSTLKRRQLQPQQRPIAARPPAIERLAVEPDIRPVTPEELAVAADQKVKSTISYATDLSLFIAACYLYLFKDARLAIPILFLMVYRQIGEAIQEKMPAWMKRKKS
jgi:titin